MSKAPISRATLERLPDYLAYLRTLDERTTHISATAIARALSLGDVQVRKDLSVVCGGGKPKVGYLRTDLIERLATALGCSYTNAAVIVGAGHLGTALLGFDGFSAPAPEIIAAFDNTVTGDVGGKPILPMDDLRTYCLMHDVRIGIITVPEEQAQSVCDRLVQCGIIAIWNFAPVRLRVPAGVTVRQENLSLSLAHLNLSVNYSIIKDKSNGQQNF